MKHPIVIAVYGFVVLFLLVAFGLRQGRTGQSLMFAGMNTLVVALSVGIYILMQAMCREPIEAETLAAVAIPAPVQSVPLALTTALSQSQERIIADASGIRIRSRKGSSARVAWSDV